MTENKKHNLVEKARRGDTAAVAELFKRYWRAGTHLYSVGVNQSSTTKIGYGGGNGRGGGVILNAPLTSEVLHDVITGVWASIIESSKNSSRPNAAATTTHSKTRSDA